MGHPRHEQRPHQEKVMTGSGHANHEAIADITDKVRTKVASHMRSGPVLQLPITNEDSGSEEKATTPAPRKWVLKSGKIHTADTTVLCKITWPHKVVYTSTWQPTEYEKMNVTLFISRFMTVMAGEKDNIKLFMLQHLNELMDD